MSVEKTKADSPVVAKSYQRAARDEVGPSAGELLSLVLSHKWLVLLIVGLTLALASAYMFVSRPVYKADGLLEVEEKAAGGMAALKNLGPLLGLGGDTTVAAEQEILTSRLVLTKVIEKQKLNMEVWPRYFPLIGRSIAKRYDGEGVAEAPLWLDSFAWGGEVLQLNSLDVPFSMLDKPLTLIAGENGEFEVFDEDDESVLKGKVGVRATAGAYSLFIPELKARAGTRFKIIRYSPDEANALLVKALTIKERGKKSGILEVTIKGFDREKITGVLNDIFNTYVRQNVERRSAEAENTLNFLEAQLPLVKKRLDQAEAAYNSYRQSRGSLDLNIETQSVLGSLVEVDNQIVALRQERDELRQYFTSEHPRIQAADARIEKLKVRKAKFESDVSRLPDTQQTVLRLARDVEVNTALYTNLLNSTQELKISKAGTIGDVRIIDFAQASMQPVGLKTPVVLVLAAAVGMVISLFAIWGVRTLRVVVDDPDQIEAGLGLPVYATIPHSGNELSISKQKGGSGLLAVVMPDDDAVESLRSLRTTIHFALLDARQNSLLITGPSPGLGKSFISKNLAAVLAQAGKRVVVVDADLRRGHINKEFGLRIDVGISEYVAGDADFESIVKPTALVNLWVVTTGQIPPNPSELLMHLRFEELLEKLSEQFDTVIVDAPPVLAVSDAAIIGRLTGATLMVARAGRHPVSELEQAVRRLAQASVDVKGFVFNDFDLERQRYKYGYKGYVYKYSYTKDKPSGQ